jgi:hypothetical protein
MCFFKKEELGYVAFAVAFLSPVVNIQYRGVESLIHEVPWLSKHHTMETCGNIGIKLCAFLILVLLGEW